MKEKQIQNSYQLDINTLEKWLWEVACKIRGEVDAPKYKDYILPLIFIKRLSDVFADEMNRMQKDHFPVRFHLPMGARWQQVTSCTSGVGQFLTNVVRAIARENPKLLGVIDTIDFNATVSGQRVISDDKLKAIIHVLGRYRLGRQDVEPDILGRAYEYLLRKFAEGAGQSGGEFYTPREVAVLMARILDPKPGMEVYDPCAGTGGLLIKTYLHLKKKNKYNCGIVPLRFYGQENLPSTYAIAKMNMFIHDMEAEIQRGDTMSCPKFTRPNGTLRTFDLVTANPMWNQDFSREVYQNDRYHRFEWGYPPANSADWGWIQHMYKSLNEKGKMAVALDTGAVSRGSGSTRKNQERYTRKAFVEKDLVETVILLPGNLFYNTRAPGVILVIKKEPQNKGTLLINASTLFKKGKPKNYLPPHSIEQIADIYLHWKEEDGISKIICKDEARKNDYNLSPSRYVFQHGDDDSLPLEKALQLLKQAEQERKKSDRKLNDILKKLGLNI
jgi:type I restriction enzyme M protein